MLAAALSGIADLLPLALEGGWPGPPAVGVVVLSIIIFMGSIFMLLASNYGARIAFHISMASLAAFMIILSLLWLGGAPGTVPGQGPRGADPHWVPFHIDSAQAGAFQEIEGFPAAWDQPGQVYPGGVNSSAELGTVRTVLAEALAQWADVEGLDATEPQDWRFRPRDVPPVTPAEEAYPEAEVRFLQVGTTLLFGVEIPPGERHDGITVFAFRDRGAIFLPSLIFLIVSVVLFILHTAILGRIERRQREDDKQRAPEEPVSV